MFANNPAAVDWLETVAVAKAQFHRAQEDYNQGMPDSLSRCRVTHQAYVEAMIQHGNRFGPWRPS